MRSGVPVLATGRPGAAGALEAATVRGFPGWGNVQLRLDVNHSTITRTECYAQSSGTGQEKSWLRDPE